MKNLILRILFYLSSIGVWVFMSGIDIMPLTSTIGVLVCNIYILAIITVNEDWLDYI